MTTNTGRPRGAFFMPARRAPSSTWRHVGAIAEALRDELALRRSAPPAEPDERPMPTSKAACL